MSNLSSSDHHLMFDADSCQAVHDGGDEAHGDANPGNDVGPADVEGCDLTKNLRPRHVVFKALVIDLKLMQASDIMGKLQKAFAVG